MGQQQMVLHETFCLIYFSPLLVYNMGEHERARGRGEWGANTDSGTKPREGGRRI